MPFNCNVCATKIYGDGGGLDVVECPKCRSMTPTGNEKRLRTHLEAYQNQLAVPRIAAGRAIGYAAGIYGLSTDNTRIDTSSIERRLVAKYGLTAQSEHTSLKMISGRSSGGVTDTRAGLMVYKTSGRNYNVGGARGQEWEIVYVVFRGSRGAKQGAENEFGAGWGKTASGQVQNVDWRANFTTRQEAPHWSAAVRVHAGFLEIYRSVRDKVHTVVSGYLTRNPHAAVVVTGHSLGAGLAILCSHDLDCSGICKPFCMPYCAPRAGNLGFARDFNSRIAEDKAVLWSEVGNVQFNRSFIFVQSNDPISWGGEHGFKHEMSARSAVKVADSGSIFRQGIYAALKKDKSDTVIYYHVRNLHRASYFGLHDYNAMEKVMLG